MASRRYPAATGPFFETTNMRLGKSVLGSIGTFRFTVRADVGSMVELLDKQTRFFRDGAFYAALAKVNDNLAKEMQQGMVDELHRQMEANDRRPGRLQRGTNYLEESLLSYKNREVYANTFTVGRPSWLDQSPAAEYWRAIEEGQPTRKGYVLFWNALGKGEFSGPWSPGGGNDKMPKGYPHMRLFMHQGGYTKRMVYPAYHYSKGAMKTGRAGVLDLRTRYEEALWDAGLVSLGFFKSGRPRVSY